MAGIDKLNYGAIDASNTALFICDIQDKFRNAMIKFDAVVSNTKKLVSF